MRPPPENSGRSPLEWTAYGPDAWLVRFAHAVGDEGFERSRAIVAELERNPPAGLREFVPAFTTILLEFAPGHGDLTPLQTRLDAVLGEPVAPGPVRELPVRYDGPDLARVAQHCGLTVEEVCARHAARTYKVYQLGFTPGFPYLGDLDPRLQTPRHPSPRPRVEPGSVAIGGEHTGIYPMAGPGGWNLIGHTTAVLFDPARGGPDENAELAFLLRPGDRVRFFPQPERA